MSSLRVYLCAFIVLVTLYQVFSSPTVEDRLAWRSSVKYVHVASMTHLDVGYSNTAQYVIQLYMNKWYPNSITTSSSLEQRGGSENFVYTTHPWLLMEAIRNGTREQVASLTKAIEKGWITWHRAPMNQQHEYADPSLYEYSLEISNQLDNMFNLTNHKSGASLKDVPCASRSIVPFMSKAGVKFLHIGANDGVVAPAAPESSPLGPICNVFLWLDRPSDSNLTVALCNGYSWGITTPAMQVIIPGFDHALVFLMQVDNSGAASESDVIQGWETIRQQFPNAEIFGSSISNFSDAIPPTIRDTLPVVTGEMGDTWIYGVPSDPTKNRVFREILRQRAHALQTGSIKKNDHRFMEFSRLLTKIPEHTWGMYNRIERLGNEIRPYFDDYANDLFNWEKTGADFISMENSWDEQRGYLYRAIDALGNHSLAGTIKKAIEKTDPRVPNLAGYKLVTPSSVASATFNCSGLSLGFDANTGSINKLVNTYDGHKWADSEHPLAHFQYQTFDQADYDTFVYNYLWTHESVDSGKPNYTVANPEHKVWQPKLLQVWVKTNPQGSCHFVLNLTLPQEAQTKYGAPPVVYVNVTAHTASKKSESRLEAHVQWFGKKPTRMAEGIWFSFNPLTQSTNWTMDKLGTWISPTEVVTNGSRYLHAVWKGVKYNGPEGEILVDSLDAPIVSAGELGLLRFDNDPLPLQREMHFNLQNNIYNTNYVLWYPWYDQGDSFRFHVRLETSKRHAKPNQSDDPIRMKLVS